LDWVEPYEVVGFASSEPRLLLATAEGRAFLVFIAEFLPPVFGQIGSALMGIVLAASFAGMGLFIWDPAMLTRAYWAG